MKVFNAKVLTPIVFIFFMSTLSACISGPSSTPADSNTSNLILPKVPPPDDNDYYEKKSYSIFYDQGDHFEELVKKGYYRKAARLYGDYEATYFDKKGGFSGKKNKMIHKPSIGLIAVGLNSFYRDKLHNIMENLKPYTYQKPEPLQWNRVKQNLSGANKIVSEYRSYSVLNEEAYRLAEIDQLRTVVKIVLEKLKQNATNAFLDYDMFRDQDFFQKYPYFITDKDRFFENSTKEMKQKLQSADCRMLEHFNSVYGKYYDEEFEDYVGNIFVTKDLVENTANSGSVNLNRIVKSLKKAEKRGFSLKKYKGKTVSFIEVTSKTLLKEGYIEFPAEVEINLPFEHRTCDLQDAFKGNDRSNFMVIFDVAQANVKRRVIKKENVKSNYLSGYRSVDNPEYRRVALDMADAERGLVSVKYQSCYSSNAWVQLACEISKAAAVSTWQQKVESAKQQYINTSPVRDEPVHEPYHFNVSDVDITKLMTVNYYIIDRINQKYFKSQFDVSEKKHFGWRIT